MTMPNTREQFTGVNNKLGNKFVPADKSTPFRK